MTEESIQRGTDPRIKILTILCKTSDNFEPLLDQIHFVGSLSKRLDAGGQFGQNWDVDILINGRDMAGQFWDFMESLLEQGLKSVHNVSEHPKTVKHWNPCRPNCILHPTLLTLDCSQIGCKNQQLDIFIDNSVLHDIPYSEKWMWNGTPFEQRPLREDSEKLSFKRAIPKVKEFLTKIG